MERCINQTSGENNVDQLVIFANERLEEIKAYIATVRPAFSKEEKLHRKELIDGVGKLINQMGIFIDDLEDENARLVERNASLSKENGKLKAKKVVQDREIVDLKTQLEKLTNNGNKV